MYKAAVARWEPPSEEWFLMLRSLFSRLLFFFVMTRRRMHTLPRPRFQSNSSRTQPNSQKPQQKPQQKQNHNQSNSKKANNNHRHVGFGANTQNQSNSLFSKPAGSGFGTGTSTGGGMFGSSTTPTAGGSGFGSLAGAASGGTSAIVRARAPAKAGAQGFTRHRALSCLALGSCFRRSTGSARAGRRRFRRGRARRRSAGPSGPVARWSAGRARHS